MKSIMGLLTLLIVLNINLSAKVVMGVDYLVGNNSFERELGDISKTEVDIDSSAIKINYGISWRDFSIIQVYVNFETYDNGIYEAPYNQYSEFGLEYIQGYEVKKDLAPYIKFGLGYGFVDADAISDNKETITAFNTKIGVGVMYKFNIFDIHAGVDYRLKFWEGVYYGSPINEILDVTENSTQMYVGMNVYF